MTQYQYYSVEDFVDDLRFRTWVRHPSPAEDQFWQAWINDHPSQRDCIAEARAIVLSIHPVPKDAITDEEIDAETAQILAQIADDEEHGSSAKANASGREKLVRWMAVAASVIILIIGAWYGKQSVTTTDGSEALLHRGVVPQGNFLIERVNKSVAPILISLPDNSSVLLSQNSLLRYPRQFSGRSRNIFLEGTAFFEVTKDPEKPFYVNAGKIIAKVLGTSFEISTNKADRQISVVVTSGTVSIYANTGEKKDEAAHQPKVILTKHEQFIFRDEADKIQHTTLDSVSIRELKVPDTNLKFVATPALEVFRSLASAYGATIDVENARIDDCTVTASFTDEPFSLKLDLICRSIGVTYEIVNDQVTITGDGCKN